MIFMKCLLPNLSILLRDKLRLGSSQKQTSRIEDSCQPHPFLPVACTICVHSCSNAMFGCLLPKLKVFCSGGNFVQGLPGFIVIHALTGCEWQNYHKVSNIGATNGAYRCLYCTIHTMDLKEAVTNSPVLTRPWPSEVGRLGRPWLPHFFCKPLNFEP